MVAGRLSCLARNGRVGVPAAPAPWGGHPRGRKPPGRRCGRGDRGTAVLGQIKPFRGTWAAPVPDRPWDGRGVARTASTALDSLGRATIHLDAQPAKAEKSSRRLPWSCPSPCAKCRRPKMLGGPPRSKQRRLRAARRRRTTGRRGAVDLVPAGLATAPGRPSTAPLHPKRGIRTRLPRVRDRARQGRNGAAGSSAADEPGPKGDARVLAVRASHSDVELTGIPVL